MSSKKITIAIDGWSSCGKSTLAKALAKALNYIYVDSGAMYRGVSLFALQNSLITNGEINQDDLLAKLNSISLVFKYNDLTQKADLYLNNENVEDKIRTLEVSEVVSMVAKIKEVRTYLVEQQRKLGENGGIVMDGRDIGSVVFPNAELKFFVTASVDVRAERRYLELKNNAEDITFERVKNNLEERDEMDSNRSESPLIQTPDAIVIDNSNLNQQQQLSLALNYVNKVLET